MKVRWVLVLFEFIAVIVVLSWWRMWLWRLIAFVRFLNLSVCSVRLGIGNVCVMELSVSIVCS